ncbi:MAG: porin [Thermodesulfobacteriota bacterium]
MKKLVVLFAAFMLISVSLPLAAQAGAPTNDELHKMIIELGKKLQTAQEEADTAKKELEEIKGAGDYDTDKALGDKKVPLNASQEKSYLKLKSADGNFEYKIDGRIMLDTGFLDNSQDANSLYANTEFRRLRLAIKTKMYKDWAGEFDVDFADEELDVKDMWVSYNGLPNTIIKLGNHKPNFCMDEVTTSRWVTFMERSMVSDAFSPGRRIGLSGTNWGKYYFAGLSVFGDELDEDKEYGSETNQSEPYSFSTRLVGRPYVTDDNSSVFHVGLNYMNRKLAKSEQAEDDEFRYKVRPEAHFVDYKMLEGAKLDAVEDVITYGLELAGKWNKFSFQGEYMISELKRYAGNDDAEFDGWYVMASYFLTNDQRPYNLDDAEFGGIVPTGKWGAWEVAARYSNLDLNDSTVYGNDVDDNGGSADAFTLALNWYINNNFMIKANYINVDYDESANMGGDLAGDDDLDIFGVRFQYLF